MKKYAIILLVILSLQVNAQSVFWMQNGSGSETTILTQAASSSITIDNASGQGLVRVDWDDGNIDTYNNGGVTAPVTHNYTPLQIRNVSIESIKLNTASVLSSLLTGVDISENHNLLTLLVYDNQIGTLDISNNLKLTYLDCNTNQLSSLNTSSNTELTSLFCTVNNISNLDVSSNTVLTTLRCGDNNISNLDLSSNTVLTTLRCGDNNISNLDLSSNTLLTTLTCEYNQIALLSTLNNTLLNTVWCYNNNLSSLDLSTNTLLINVRCQDNNLAISSVNDILTVLDSHGLSNGTLIISNQSPSAPPSGAGLTAKANLIAKGWTVVTD